MVVYPRVNNDGTASWTCPKCLGDNRLYDLKARVTECLKCGSKHLVKIRAKRA